MPRPIARPATLAWALSLACCLVLTSGCSLATSNGSVPSRAPATLNVENDAFSDLVIYVATQGTRQRLGIARGLTTTNFEIPRAVVAGSPTVRFLADDIGGSRPEVSQQTNIAPGDTVVMVIQRDP